MQENIYIRILQIINEDTTHLLERSDLAKRLNLAVNEIRPYLSVLSGYPDQPMIREIERSAPFGNRIFHYYEILPLGIELLTNGSEVFKKRYTPEIINHYHDIFIGDIKDSTGIAIGENVSASVNTKQTFLYVNYLLNIIEQVSGSNMIEKILAKLQEQQEPEAKRLCNYIIYNYKK